MPRKLAHVSARKIAANRKNALKSTGPKTSRGKANSRTNALKHGLFAMDLYIASLTNWENPEEYQRLLDRLTESYQPVGAAEELEVQQIAMCWWKRARAWRYENAEIALQLCLRHTDRSGWDSVSWQHKARLAVLNEAELEIEATGTLSEELKARIFGDAECAELWKFAAEQLSEGLAQQLGVPLPVIKDARDSDPESGKNFLLGTAQAAALIHVRDKERLVAGAAKLANDIEAIPGAEALDRCLRAEAATERSLNRAIYRLENLQRRRQCESVPLSLSVR
ncbi:MAG: hypothetical protein WCA19_08145 [Candidatus Acidiferrales bacterium]